MRLAGDAVAVACTRPWAPEPVVEHWLEVRAGPGGARIDGAPPSLDLRLPVTRGRGGLRWWRSAWGEEWQPASASPDGDIELRSLAGRSSARLHPFALLDGDDGVRAIAIAWSGNWQLTLRRLDDRTVALTAGLGDHDFAHDVAPDTTFRGPTVTVATAADGDPETAARALARVGRRHWFARRPVAAALPREWNHWWPYEDAGIDRETFLANARAARGLGLDVAVLDAGWFGPSDPSTHWYDVRGDWERVNEARFPGGLPALADEVHALGLGFGLWLEIEAVGQQARLRELRPDLLAVGHPAPDAPVRAGGGVEPDPEGRPVDLGYVCLGNPAAQEWAFDVISTYAERCDLDWLKLDMNLDPGLGCTREDHGHGAADGLWAHVNGLYALLDRLRAAHADLLVEACGSGGLRWDHGLARHVDVGFQSDPDWPEHALQVLWAASLFFPLETLLHWCDSEWRGDHPQQRFRADDPALDAVALDRALCVAMLGPLGLSQRLVDLPAWAAARVAELVALHRDVVGPCVARGELRRLSEQPLRDGGGARWVGFQLDVADGDPVPHLVAAFRLDGAPDACPLRAVGLRAGGVQVTSLLDGATHQATVDADGGLALDLRLRSGEAWLGVLREAS